VWNCCIKRQFATAKRNVRRECSLDEAHSYRNGKEHLVDRQPGPGQALMALERDAALQKVIARLPARPRAILRLRTRDRLSFRQIGARLGRSAAAMRMACRRVVRYLRERVAS
jgi:RNA polymerase sigma factor (sigma-70 family)